MSKSVASETNKRNKTTEPSMKRGAGDEGKENGGESIEETAVEDSTTLTTPPPTAPETVDEFMHTPEFRRHFAEFFHDSTLMALRVATKRWNAGADVLIDEGVESGQLMVHYGKDISWSCGDSRWKDRKVRTKLLTRVIILLNIKKVGEYACNSAINLVVVDIPEGVERIGKHAFHSCRSLTTVSFPTTLTRIGNFAFHSCTSLENVDLLHTNLQEFSQGAFAQCSELKSMTIPNSLQTFGADVFAFCSKLVPSSIDVSNENHDDEYDATPEVIDYLQYRSEIAALKLQLSEQSTMFQTQIAQLSTSLQSELIAVKQTLQTLISTLTKNK